LVISELIGDIPDYRIDGFCFIYRIVFGFFSLGLPKVQILGWALPSTTQLVQPVHHFMLPTSTRNRISLYPVIRPQCLGSHKPQEGHDGFSELAFGITTGC
jgi:hypothetical protein